MAGSLDITRVELVTSAPQVSNHLGPHWIVEARILDGAGDEVGVLVREFEESFPVDQIGPAMVQEARQVLTPLLLVTPGETLEV